MDLVELNLASIIEGFVLLLIGVGPKIALVPFLELTRELPRPVRMQVIRKMLTTVSVAAVFLLLLGGVLTRLFHFSQGALSVASGIILLIIAINMVISREQTAPAAGAPTVDPARLAVYPLAVPYLLNPAGIVVLVTASAEATAALLAVTVGLLALVIVVDVMVFRLADRLSPHLQENRMLVTEKVFGFLLAALGVQLVLNGLESVGVIGLVH